MADNKLIKTNVGDQVLTRIDELCSVGFTMPKDYSYVNAIKMSMLKLQDVKDKFGKPALEVCTPTSIQTALFKMATKGLNAALNQCYFIVRGNTLCCDESYFGKVLMVRRLYPDYIPTPVVIREGDVFEFEYGLEPKLRHIPARENRGNPIYYYACFKNKAGGSGFHVMSVEEMREFAKKYSKAYGSSYSPWNTNFSAMARKTILKQVLKFAPLRTELMKELSNDGTIKNSLAEDMSDVPNEMEYVEVEAEEAPQTDESVPEKPSEAE